MDVKEAAVRRAISILDTVGAKYHVKLGQLELGQSLTEEKKSLKFPRGFPFKDYYLEQVENMKIGDVVRFMVPRKEMIAFGHKPYRFRDVLRAACCTHFGKGGFELATDEDVTYVDILRLPPPISSGEIVSAEEFERG